MAHTPEPWEFSQCDGDPYAFWVRGFSGNPSIIGADGKKVVGCDEYYVFSGPDDIARIVACANACTGIPITDLTPGSVKRDRAELERARSALRAFIAWMDDSRTPGHAVNPVRYMAHCDLLDDADRLARAALANPSETPNGSAAPYEPSKRPKGSNADEWQLFITEHPDASAFLAVQIAEAIDDARKGAQP